MVNLRSVRLLELDKIYNMDCIEGMKQLQNCSIDLIITDPPYNKKKDYGNNTDNKPQKEFDKFNYEWLKEVFRILKFGHHFYFSCASNQIFYFKEICDQIGFRYRHLLIWFPNEYKARMNPQTWQRAYEPIFWFQKHDNNGSKYGLFNNYPFHNMDVLMIRSPHINHSNMEKKYHVAQKPTNLFKTIIAKSSKKGDIVLDPFMGSGTTAISCKFLDRHFIGFELNPEYIKIGNKRTKNIPEKLNIY